MPDFVDGPQDGKSLGRKEKEHMLVLELKQACWACNAPEATEQQSEQETETDIRLCSYI